ncbi:hypothetical protein [Pantoea sp. CCBC3-3-1]|uniref:hypothetical protein n=1 Tax=Pantoea sp. CCBC3-3-1 TaxID=2490851 RepID=UPI0011BDC0F0|nr:hypothetical protein [Pantoea sp. CCBC3-3-1]
MTASQPCTATTPDQELYYLQDSRNYSGNDILWWGLEGRGYVTDLKRAQTYTREEAQLKHNCRDTDIPWPKAYIDARWRPAVDMQDCNRSEALQGTGIVLAKPKKRRKPVFNCCYCGKFLSEHDYYSGPYGGHPCRHCEKD